MTAQPSFRAPQSGEPGIHTPCIHEKKRASVIIETQGLWIPGSALRAAPE
jgi:hypothetical protein